MADLPLSTILSNLVKQWNGGTQAVVFAMENILPEHLYNVGTGNDLTFKELAETIQKSVGHSGKIVRDTSKPDGTPRKLMDSSKLNRLGWKFGIGLNEGIENTYNWFLKNKSSVKKIKP